MVDGWMDLAWRDQNVGSRKMELEKQVGRDLT